MKINFKVEDLLEAMNRLAVVAAKAKDEPSKHVLISSNDGEAILTAVDGRIQKSVTINSTGDPLEIAVRFDKLISLLKTLPKDKFISIKADNGSAVIVCGKSRVKSPVIDQSLIPTINTGSFIDIDIDFVALSEAISMVSFASAKDDINKAINGVVVSRDEDSAKVAATNKHFIAIKSVPCSGLFDEFIIPINLITVAAKDIAECTRMQLSRSHVIISGTDFKTFLPLIDMKYLNFRAANPSGRFNIKHELTFSKEQMTECLKRVSSIADDPRNSRCIINADIGDVEAVVVGKFIIGDANEISDAIPMTHVGSEPMKLAYDPSFVLHGLRHIKSDTITCKIYDNKVSPMVIEEDGFTCIISQVMV